jgi:hypothetical protein
VSLHHTIQLALVGVSLLLLGAIVVFELLGRRYGRWRALQTGHSGESGTSAVEASLFALLGLLVAFSFSGAETRLLARQQLLVSEANAIEAAYLRLDVLPEPGRAELKDDFRRYLDARIAFYDPRLDVDNARAQHARELQLRRTIWTRALEASTNAGDDRIMPFVLPAITQMFDAGAARNAALRIHVPPAIFLFLALIAFACAFVAGMNMSGAARASPLHYVLFAGTMAITALLVLNVEFPLAGFLHLQFLDDVMVQLRASMN